MTDIKPTLDAIDECPPCPMCGVPVVSISRGRTHVDGPFRPTTFQPCGCQPGARLEEGLATGGLVFPPHNPFWMLEANPTHHWATPRFEPGELTHVSIGGVDITGMVRSVTLDNSEATFTPTGIVATAPEPPSSGDVLSNLRTAHQRIAELDRPERTVVAGPEMASRIEGLGIPVVESPLVPEGQVYVINQPEITGPMFSEPMSYRFDQDAATYRFGMRFTCDRPRSTFDVLRDYAMCRDHARERQQRYERRLRAQQLHRAYRQRSLARRRRSR